MCAKLSSRITEARLVVVELVDGNDGLAVALNVRRVFLALRVFDWFGLNRLGAALSHADLGAMPPVSSSSSFHSTSPSSMSGNLGDTDGGAHWHQLTGTRIRVAAESQRRGALGHITTRAQGRPLSTRQRVA